MTEPQRDTIPHADLIIERFGGIRPMASKMNIPVTTVQGWKKRNAIPVARLEDVKRAAADNALDISDILEQRFISTSPESEALSENIALEPPKQLDSEVSSYSSSSENQTGLETPQENILSETVSGIDADTGIADVVFVTEDNQSAPSSLIIDTSALSSVDRKNLGEQYVKPKKVDEFSARKKDTTRSLQKTNPDFSDSRSYTQIAVDTEARAVTKSSVISFVLLLVALGGVSFYLLPRMEEQGKRLQGVENSIGSIKNDLDEVKEKQSNFMGLVPENWSEQLEDLKKQINGANNLVGQTVGNVSNDIMNGDLGNIQTKVHKLEGYVDEITNSNPMISSLMNQLDFLNGTKNGQKQLKQSVGDLLALMQGKDGEPVKLDSEKLEEARRNNESLETTFEGVPKEDLEAAAMLLSLTQMRYALSRDKQPFGPDLELLMNMVDKDNVKLREALLRLAPHAEKGVLTPSALASQFSGLAGDVVVSSLKGEDVSISDQAKARFNNLFQIEKDGELLTGTETQAKVKKAQNLLDKGNVQGALEILNTLKSEQKKPLEDWMEQAQTTVDAQAVKDLIGQTIDMTLGGGLLGGSNILSGEGRGGLSVDKR